MTDKIEVAQAKLSGLCHLCLKPLELHKSKYCPITWEDIVQYGLFDDMWDDEDYAAWIESELENNSSPHVQPPKRLPK